jgi:hypothetical protein
MEFGSRTRLLGFVFGGDGSNASRRPEKKEIDVET